MTSTTSQASPVTPGSRILSEGYGPGAWHGPDLQAALADVTAEAAFRRPAEGRHNIAEIALHHAYTVRNVLAKISAHAAEPFELDGEDWFTLENEKTMKWSKVQSIVANAHRRLADFVADVEAGRATSPLSEEERFNLLLGTTCHAVYHAGQVQLIKRLIAV